MKCQICGKEFKNYRAIRIHIEKSHPRRKREEEFEEWFEVEWKKTGALESSFMDKEGVKAMCLAARQELPKKK